MTVESVTPEAPAPGSCAEPPFAGGGVPLLGHGWKLVRDPLGFLARLRDHGDVVRLQARPEDGVRRHRARSWSGTLRAQPRLQHRRPAVGVPRRAARQGGRGHRQRARCTGVNGAPSSPRSGSDVIPEYGPIMVEEAHAFAGRLAARGRSSTAPRRPSGSPCASRPAVCCAASYMDERAERLCAALATVFLRDVPAHGDPGGTALPAAASGQPQIQPGPGRYASRSSTRSWPNAGHPVKSRTIC